MNETRDFNHTDAEEHALDPREAQVLLEQTRRQAARRLNFHTPLLSLVGAAAALSAFGAVWLSVRGQHPYKGPTAGGLVVMYGILICWFGVLATVSHRANAGVSGRSIRQQRAYGAVLVAALVAVSVYQGVLKHDGVSLAIVYGTYPPTAQLIVMGSIAAAIAGSREDWPSFGVGLGAILVATVGAFFGPVGVWLADGIGMAIVVVGYSAAQAWARQR